MSAERHPQREVWERVEMLVNPSTGEFKHAPLDDDYQTVRFAKKHRAGRHMSTLMDALEGVAKDKGLTVTDHRVLRLIESKVEYANSAEGHPDAYVRIVQAGMARELEIDRSDINRSIKKLLDRHIILRMAPRGQAAQYYAINPNYGWRGKHKGWKDRRGKAPSLTLLRGGAQPTVAEKVEIAIAAGAKPTAEQIAIVTGAPTLIDA